MAAGGRPPLGATERILLAVAEAHAVPFVATTAALHWRDGDGSDSPWRRVAWADVDAVGWDRRLGLLTVTDWATSTTWRVALGARHRTRLVALVHERVAATVLIRRRVVLTGGREALVTARCRDGSAGVEWVVVLAGAEPADDGVWDDITSAIRWLSAELGTPGAARP